MAWPEAKTYALRITIMIYNNVNTAAAPTRGNPVASKYPWLSSTSTPMAMRLGRWWVLIGAGTAWSSNHAAGTDAVVCGRHSPGRTGANVYSGPIFAGHGRPDRAVDMIRRCNGLRGFGKSNSRFAATAYQSLTITLPGQGVSNSIDPTASSTCELIYLLLRTWGHAHYASDAMPRCLHTTDTCEKFRTSNTTPSALRGGG